MWNTVKQLWLPLLLVCVLLLAFNYGYALPMVFKQVMLGISLFLKWLIMLVIPFFIAIFVAHSIVEMRRSAVSYFLYLLCFVVVSNFIAVMFGYSFVHLFEAPHSIAAQVHNTEDALEPFFGTPTWRLLSNPVGLISGIVAGFVISFTQKADMIAVLDGIHGVASRLLRMLIIPALPLLIAGFALKMEHEKVLDNSLAEYEQIFVLFSLSQVAYVFLLLVIINKLNFKKIGGMAMQVLPAAITGFSTLSSVATMPVTIECARKITNNSSVPKLFIPATVNIHLIGTAIGMNVIILCCLNTANGIMPDLWHFLPFACYFVLTMFAVAGVPGGSIFTIAPLIEQYLGGSPELIALITTLVILFDPVDTSFNVTVNALMTRVFAGLLGSKFGVSVSNAISRFAPSREREEVCIPIRSSRRTEGTDAR